MGCTDAVHASPSVSKLPSRRHRRLNRKYSKPESGHQAGKTTNPQLIRAIAEKRLIEFVYRVGRTRTVEPHDYGIRGGVEYLLGYQLSGGSRSGARHGWKWFTVAQMHQLCVLESRFAGTRADSEQQHSTWDTLFARVA
jgi:predicted DNA-binding transcriptional regulator YafY